MAVFEIRGKDGNVFEIEAPDEQSALKAYQDQTAGGMVGDVMRSGASGMARGGASLLDLPANIPGYIAQAGVWAGDKAGIIDDDWAQNFHETMSDFRSHGGADAMARKAAPRVMNYEPNTTPGEFAQTIGEFLPGASIGATARAPQSYKQVTDALLRYGAIPGAAAETAGQLTEGTAAEPYARTGAALIAGTLAGTPTGRVRPPGADPEDVKMAETLMRHNVKPTVGQITGSPLLRKMEGTQGAIESQADDFTRAAMKTTGSTANRAIPEALKSASDDIVGAMDDAVSGVTFTPTQATAQRVNDIVTDYLESTPNASVVPKVKTIADELIEMGTNPTPAAVDLSTIKQWRSRLGGLMNSNDSEVRSAAWALRGVIDDATEDALMAAGRTDDIAKLTTAREQYRNWLAVADAATRAGAEGGRVSAPQLQQSVIRSQGRRNAAIGNTTELGELSRSGAGLMRAEPTVSPGGVRTIAPQLGGALGGGAVGAQLMPDNPIVGALLGAGAGNAAISGGQYFMRSQPVQSTILDPFGKIMEALARTAPGAEANVRN